MNENLIQEIGPLWAEKNIFISPSTNFDAMREKYPRYMAICDAFGQGSGVWTTLDTEMCDVIETSATRTELELNVEIMIYNTVEIVIYTVQRLNGVDPSSEEGERVRVNTTELFNTHRQEVYKLVEGYFN